jgi:hypothetical protein
VYYQLAFPADIDMTRPGVHYTDLQPLDKEPQAEIIQPSGNFTSSLPTHKPESNLLGTKPTASHELAAADHDEKGVVQDTGVDDVVDLGWHEDDSRRPKPLVGGMNNEDLWLLIRRFDKVGPSQT